MTDLLPTDVLLVNRGGVDHSVTKANLMATVQDTDLLLVNRAGVDYKATYADVKKGFGPQRINPAPGDWTFNPAIAGGAGTQADPFIISPTTVANPGDTVLSVQTLTLTGLTPNSLVTWTDNSVGAGTRFNQNMGIVPASGQVDLQLSYTDTPASTASTVFTGDLQIGTSYFRWVVTQQTVKAPVINTVVLADSPQAGRFTSGTFATTVTMTEDGVPASTKGLKAWVAGTLKSQAISDVITAKTGTGSPGTDGTPTGIQYRTSNAASTNAKGVVYGKTAQDANNNANHPLFQWAAGLNIGGHTDWYIPAKNEMDILYRNLKPLAETNMTSYGANTNAVPPAGNYTAGSPAQTTAVDFRFGGAQAFVSAHSKAYWIATEHPTNSTRAWTKYFDKGTESYDDKDSSVFCARAIRRVAYTGSEPAIGAAYQGGYFGGLISTAGTGVADYALIVAPNGTGTYGYTAGTPADPLVLTLQSNKDLALFAAGDAVTEKTAGGTAGDATGTVTAVDATAKTVSLLPVSGTWDVGSSVKGPQKSVANTKLYTVHNAAGVVTDLRSADPGYVTMTGSSPYTLTFPATLPSGRPPDTDLPVGTTLTTEIEATNASGTVTKTSNTVNPA